MTLQRALSTVKRLSEAAEPPSGSSELTDWLDHDKALVRLHAAAPDLAASVVEMAEALEWAVNEWRDTPVSEYRKGLEDARVALASFAARFGAAALRAEVERDA